MVGKPWYRTPEVLHREGYPPESDTWSLGVILYFIQNRVLPFDASSKLAERRSTLNGIPGNKIHNCSAETQGLIRSVFAKQPDYRPTPEELLADTVESGDGS